MTPKLSRILQDGSEVSTKVKDGAQKSFKERQQWQPPKSTIYRRSYWSEELEEGSPIPRWLFHWPTSLMEIFAKIRMFSPHPRATELEFLQLEPRGAYYWNSTAGDFAASLVKNHCFKSLSSGVYFPGWITYQAFISHQYLIMISSTD